jgi:farnesyl-diphosphate farnesyltransferase
MPDARREAALYCREALPRVSRTFALNIRLLSGTLREAVSLGYLLCRIADTLEDAWPDGGPAAAERFDLFTTALAGGDGAAERLAAEAPPSPTAPDLDLVRHSPVVFASLDLLPAEPRAAVVAGVRTLAAGMRPFVARAPGRRGRAYLEDEAELHGYCYAVAGCVGEMLTRLFGTCAGVDPGRLRRLGPLAPGFGEGLQLTNILLDLHGDLRRGRCYLPQSWLDAEGLAPGDLLDARRDAEARRLLGRLESLALTGLDQACRYTLLLPARHWRYRLFCAWPLLWAAGSLREARGLAGFPHSAARPRLPRAELRRLARAAGWRVLSNRALGALYHRTRPADRPGS